MQKQVPSPFHHLDRLAFPRGRSLACRGQCLDSGAEKARPSPLRGVPRTGLSRRRRLYGPRQLGDLARRRRPVRLRASDGRAALQHDGDPAAGAVRAARHRLGARPRAGLPRQLPDARLLRAVDTRGGARSVATDLAEVIGTAIGLNLLFGIPLEIGVIITALDVFLILWLQRLGFRWVEAMIVTLLGVIAAVLRRADRDGRPGLGPRSSAALRRRPMSSPIRKCSISRSASSARPSCRTISICTRPSYRRANVGPTVEERRDGIRLATWDSTIALMFALTINASILILAAAGFNRTGERRRRRARPAHELLAPLLGSTLAPSLFAIALLCCGLNSTVTATLAGQAVMEGFLNIRLRALAAPSHHALNRHRPRRRRHHFLRRERHRLAAHHEPGRAEPAASLRGRAARHVHGQPSRRWARSSRRAG